MLVHREPFARPVTGAAEFFELLDDDAAVFFLPRPDALDEFLASEVLFGLFFLLFYGFLDLPLRGDAGVVHARQPESLIAQHAGAAGEDVLNRGVEHVAEREDAGDVRGRDDDGISRLF